VSGKRGGTPGQPTTPGSGARIDKQNQGYLGTRLALARQKPFFAMLQANSSPNAQPSWNKKKKNKGRGGLL